MNKITLINRIPVTTNFGTKRTPNNQQTIPLERKLNVENPPPDRIGCKWKFKVLFQPSQNKKVLQLMRAQSTVTARASTMLRPADPVTQIQ